MSDLQKYQLKKRRLDLQLVEKLSRLVLIIGGVILLVIWMSRYF